MDKTPGVVRNNQRIKVTLPDHLLRHVKRVSSARRIPLSKYISLLLVDILKDETSFLKHEKERLAQALVAVDAKSKVKKLGGLDIMSKLKEML